MNNKKAFTLIELLVVISIIALLVSILMPALSRARNLAKQVACNSNLHQWGLMFAMYTSDNNDTYMAGIDADWATGQYSWIVALMPYSKTPEIRLCPSVERTEAEGAKLPKAAWDMTPDINAGSFSELRNTEYKTGSYGINWWVNSGGVNGTFDGSLKWKKSGQKNSSEIPVLMDCGFILARPQASDVPPVYDGQFAWAAGGYGLRRVCTDRHQGSVNLLYMDSSSRKSQLKDLWKQRWHKNYSRPQTEPTWPDWMRNL